MLKIKRIDHVAICVPDVDAALPRYQEILGLRVEERELVPSQKTEAALLPVGATSLELISPKGNPALERFLERRGAGLHHIAVEVERIEEALKFLAGLGVPLIDATPRIGARGHKVAFLHPKALGGVLVELVEPLGSACEEFTDDPGAESSSSSSGASKIKDTP
jgi:methylmalonyl-CoA/ethylmalonyl-CoA epimerase